MTRSAGCSHRTPARMPAAWCQGCRAHRTRALETKATTTGTGIKGTRETRATTEIRGTRETRGITGETTERRGLRAREGSLRLASALCARHGNLPPGSGPGRRGECIGARTDGERPDLVPRRGVHHAAVESGSDGRGLCRGGILRRGDCERLFRDWGVPL